MYPNVTKRRFSTFIIVKLKKAHHWFTVVQNTVCATILYSLDGYMVTPFEF